jgi:hypothetical protein
MRTKDPDMNCCPKCKGDPRVTKSILSFQVECTCGIRGPLEDSKHQAIAMWNRLKFMS